MKVVDVADVDGDCGSGSEASLAVASLNPREIDILVGVVRGRPNKMAAYDMGVSVRTVEANRARMMCKLGASSIRDAVRIAHAAGLGRDLGVGRPVR